MMSRVTLTIFLIFPLLLFAQYPFEKFKSTNYKSFDLFSLEKDSLFIYSNTLQSFFNDKTDLQITIREKDINSDDTYIELKSNTTSKKYLENILSQGMEGLYVADFNGDKLKDIKIVSYYMGCGLASMNVRVIYLFQKKNKEFVKICFDDKMDSNRLERDLDGDGNFEIITMTLQEHKKHNYWLFNLYNYIDEKLICVNKKFNYPIMVQYLFRDNFEITNKLSRNEMKKYQIEIPQELQIEK